MFAVALLVLGVVVVFAERAFAEAAAMARAVRQTSDAVDALVDVERSMREAESLRRAYALTGEETLRARALDAAKRSEAALTGARSFDATSPLRAALDRRVAVLSAALDRRRAGFSLEKEVAATNEGMAVSAELSRVLDDALRRQRLELDDRQRASESAITRAEYIGAFGLAASVALSTLAMIVLLLEMRRRFAAERDAAAALDRAVVTNAELEAFSYSVSHDLRSPLRAIDGFSLAVLEDAGPVLDDEARANLDRVRAAATRMGVLIDALLDLARLTRTPLDRQDVDLGAVAKSVVEDVRAANPGRDVAVTITPGLRARCDARMIRIVLDNLIANAFKFTAKTKEPEIVVDGRVTEDLTEVTVRDNGAGFDERYADKLFGVFKRLHDVREYPGNGVGLATVHRIVTRHGGTIRASGKPGAGATFTFTLPATESSS